MLSAATAQSASGLRPRLVAVALVGGAVRVSVADRGLGIAAADRGRIFEKFFRASSDGRTIGGTGLGLAVCKEIVESHASDIGFDTSEGNGSTFWFEVPVTAGATEA